MRTILIGCFIAGYFPVIAQVSIVSTELTNYLQLNPAQVEAIRTLKTSETLARISRVDRRRALNEQFAAEVDSGSPDPNRLGGLFVAIEMLDRDDVVGAAQVAKGFQDLLHAEQKVLLGPLRDAQRRIRSPD